MVQPYNNNPDALMQRLMELSQEAESIMAQLEAMGVNPEQLMAGGGPEYVPATPVPEMPQMPVQGNTEPLGGLLG